MGSPMKGGAKFTVLTESLWLRVTVILRSNRQFLLLWENK